jgi:chemotaxis response regulator CheB
MVGSSTPRAPIRVLVADDQRLFANMLEAILASDQRAEIVGGDVHRAQDIVVNVG